MLTKESRHKRNGISSVENQVGKNGLEKNVDKKTFDNSKTHPTVYTIFISLLLDLLAFTMILPLLPSLLEYYRINDKLGLHQKITESIQYFQEFVGAPAKYNSVLFGGFLGSMYSFLQFVASPIVGGLSDVYGRKPVLLFCMVSCAYHYQFLLILIIH